MNNFSKIQKIHMGLFLFLLLFCISLTWSFNYHEKASLNLSNSEIACRESHSKSRAYFLKGEQKFYIDATYNTCEQVRVEMANKEVRAIYLVKNNSIVELEVDGKVLRTDAPIKYVYWGELAFFVFCLIKKRFEQLVKKYI